MMKKLLSILVVALVVFMAVPAHTEAKVVTTSLPLDIEFVKVNGDKLHENGQTVNENVIDDIERDQEISFTVSVANTGKTLANGSVVEVDLEDVNVHATLFGYDQHPGYLIQSEADDEEDLDFGHGQTYKFTMDLPYKLDQGDYVINVIASGRIKNFDELQAAHGDAEFQHERQTLNKEYAITIDAEDHALVIKDVIFSPSSTVKAGTSLLTKVRVKNTGNEDDTEGIQVKLNIPELGLEATDWLEELDEEESQSSEELWVIIPKCTAAGTYDVNVDVYFDDGDHKESMQKQITVYENENCEVAGAEETSQETTLLTVGTQTQNVVKGQAGVIYPVTISNNAKSAKTYVVNVDGYQDWAQVSVSPSNVLVVNPGEAVAAYVHVSALDTATPGEHMFALSVNSGNDQLEQFAVKANVQGEAPSTEDNSGSSLGEGLTIALIVLVVILVLLGLIIGFNRLRGDDDEDFDDEEGQTYY